MDNVSGARFMEKVGQKFPKGRRAVGYLSMEYGIRQDVKVYSGGLGMLSGDTIKSSADRGLPLAAVGLFYRDGFFRQEIRNGLQVSLPDVWEGEKHPAIVDTEKVITVKMEGKPINLKIWGMEVPGEGGDFVPLFLLDSAGVQNPLGFEKITRRLYNPEPWDRMTQEMALGRGGLRALDALGISPTKYHMNEGHAAFAVVEDLGRLGKSFENISPEELAASRERFAFTTHTPVAAGFDRFHRDLVLQVFTSDFDRRAIFSLGMDPRNADFINMAYLAMRGSSSINAVSQIHAGISRCLFDPLRDSVDVSRIFGITNGVHHLTWTSKYMASVYDRHAPEWRKDPTTLKQLRYKIDDPEFRKDIDDAHRQAKIALFSSMGRPDFDPDVFTIGFARRFAGYKRGDLIFTNLEDLKRIANEVGPIQLVFAGKAHPADSVGQNIIANVIQRGKQIEEETGGRVKFIFIPNYDMDSGAAMTAGVDIWLNNPIPPYEASGTSGMKAALNGVPHVSTYDGWWPEGSHADMTGWTFGNSLSSSVGEQGSLYDGDSLSLYRTLGQITRLYYEEGKEDPQYSSFLDKRIYAAALNGSYFNTHRMVGDYSKVWGI